MVLPKLLRGFLILNTIVLGIMLLYLILFSIVSSIPSSTSEVVFASILIIDVGVLLYTSGSSLSEYQKYFNGLGSGITGCVLSALSMGVMPFLTLLISEIYVYSIIIVYSLLISIFYIFFNELYGRKLTLP